MHVLRHVALWEAEQARRLVKQDDVWTSFAVSMNLWCSHCHLIYLWFTLYQYEEVHYERRHQSASPVKLYIIFTHSSHLRYPWDPSFNTAAYGKLVNYFNQREFERLRGTVKRWEEIGDHG